MALVLHCVRRSGKSTLLGQLLDRYRLDRAKCLFMNFEDSRLSSALDFTTLQGLVDGFEARAGSEAIHLFDEIQWVEGWQGWLRTQLDRPRGRRFILTGPNGRLLSGEYRELHPGAPLSAFLEAGGFPEPSQVPGVDRVAMTLPYPSRPRLGRTLGVVEQPELEHSVGA